MATVYCLTLNGVTDGLHRDRKALCGYGRTRLARAGI